MAWKKTGRQMCTQSPVNSGDSGAEYQMLLEGRLYGDWELAVDYWNVQVTLEKQHRENEPNLHEYNNK